MTVIPIARYLVQFGIGGGSGAAGASHDGRGPQSCGPPTEEDVARRIEAAAVLAREEGRAAAAAELEARLAEERVLAGQRVAEEREAWLAGEGRRLGSAMDAALGQLEAAIAEHVAEVLRPFVTAALRDQALAALKEALRTLLSGEPALVRVVGPAPLLEAMRQEIGPDRLGVDYVVAEDADIRVVADHTVIETQMKAWIGRFDQASAQAAR